MSSSASRHDVIDPHATWEGLSVRPLGHRTYLKAKAGGESSMFGKAGCREAARRYAGRGPDGMAKPALAEPKCPNRNITGRIRRMTSDAPQNVKYSLGLTETDHPLMGWPDTLQGRRVASSDFKDTKWAPKPS